MSSLARGLTETDLEVKPAQFATPDDVVPITLESDRALAY
jgi:hypothetical protein